MELFWTFAGIGVLIFAATAGVSMLILALKHTGKI